MSSELEVKAINTLRFLSADMVQHANSGHPGLPMGAAAMAYTIWIRHMRHNPLSPKWFGRDRFILSGGHGSALLYSLLYLTGYDLTLDDLMAFRQWGSKTPGHPEYGLTPGVENTTGPLGQGFANGVGFAIAEAKLAAEFNRTGHEVISNFVYAIVTDGDLMEGVTAEAASLAGHLQLGKIIYLYDDNGITIDGPTNLTFTENRLTRFEAYGWGTQLVQDGNDIDAIDSAIRAAKEDNRPSLIACKTHIGFGMPGRQDTSRAHGEPPGEEELRLAKVNLGWPTAPNFIVPKDVLEHFRSALSNGKRAEANWQKTWIDYQKKYPNDARELERRIFGRLPEGWSMNIPKFVADPKGMATRAASGKVLNILAKELPELLGGSADLTPSNNTFLAGISTFQKGTQGGRNFHFGVREHGMGAIINGISLYGGLLPYGATFLVFSDYMRGAIRVGALSKVPSIWIFTHDSIGVGEDGPTHQPVEHLAALRAIPGLVVIRPCDANETAEAWKTAIRRRNGPTALILTRQTVPTFDRSSLAPAEELARGAYILTDIGEKPPKLILMASGSEVQLILAAGKRLGETGVSVRIISFPSWELFAAQDHDYQDLVIPKSTLPRLAVEAGISQGWERWVGSDGAVIGLEHYGASAPGKILYDQFGISVERILDRSRELLGRSIGLG